jgi:Lar family restriction alleviation protein
MSEVQLQPCPRCGGGALAGVTAQAGGTVLSVHCSVCGTRTPGRPTIEEAVTEWNRRLLYTMAPGAKR